MSIQLEVWGDYALFTRPEMKVERVSYDIMTPSAARGLVEAIYWHPGLKWIIDRIHVCAPIRFTNLRRNEVKSTLSARSARTVMERGKGELYLCTSDDIQQRAALLLRDVRYVMADRFVLTLINNRIVGRQDFDFLENGAVFLSDSGRRAVLKRWQERKKESLTHPYLQEKLSWGLVPYLQALLLARCLRGDLDAYPPFLWK